MSGHTRGCFLACFCGLAVVLGESWERERAIAALQPADVAERDSKARGASNAVEKRICNAHTVTVERMLIGPSPNLPQHADYMQLVGLQRRRHRHHFRVRIEIRTHFDPIAGHVFGLRTGLGATKTPRPELLATTQET